MEGAVVVQGAEDVVVAFLVECELCITHSTLYIMIILRGGGLICLRCTHHEWTKEYITHNLQRPTRQHQAQHPEPQPLMSHPAVLSPQERRNAHAHVPPGQAGILDEHRRRPHGKEVAARGRLEMVLEVAIPPRLRGRHGADLLVAERHEMDVAKAKHMFVHREPQFQGEAEKG